MSLPEVGCITDRSGDSWGYWWLLILIWGIVFRSIEWIIKNSYLSVIKWQNILYTFLFIFLCGLHLYKYKVGIEKLNLLHISWAMHAMLCPGPHSAILLQNSGSVGKSNRCRKRQVEHLLKKLFLAVQFWLTHELNKISRNRGKRSTSHTSATAANLCVCIYACVCCVYKSLTTLKMGLSHTYLFLLGIFNGVHWNSLPFLWGI